MDRDLIDSPMTDPWPHGNAARDQAEVIIATWSAGEPADTLAALSRFPHLRLDKSVVLDLAYEEFCLRVNNGERVDADEFCARFPDYRTSLRNLIDVHRFIEDQPQRLTQAPVFQWPRDGEFFDEYRILRQLGRGAFARVYLAWHDATSSRVVVKVSIAGAAEGRLAGPLEHDAVVPIKHAGSLPSGVSFLVMPFLGCATLQDVLDSAFPAADAKPTRADVILRAQQKATKAVDGAPAPSATTPLSEATWYDGVTFLLTHLARGLAFLHARGIRHRDLKPSNVLLRWDGRPVILDFNLSEAAQAKMPRCGGTMPYMAPEQIQAGLRGAKTGEFDERADLFSFGVIAYELLTGSHPYGMPGARVPTSQESLRAREVAAWLLGRQRSGFEPLRHKAPSIDPQLARLIQQCLSFDPAHRPSAVEVVTRLERLERWPRRRRRLVVAACVALAAVAVGLGGFEFSRRPSVDRENDAAMAAFQSGDYQRAGTLFDELIKQDVNNAHLYFLRGLTALRQEKFEEATINFLRSSELEEDGRTLEFLGYCHALRNDYTAASHHLTRARALGRDSAVLLNNRGHAYSRGMVPGVGMDQKNAMAREDLDEAIRREPGLCEAYWNRAYLDYRLWEKKKDADALARAAVDIDRALTKSYASARPYMIAAGIHASLPGSSPEKTNKILGCLREAIARGQQPKWDDSIYENYRALPDFQALKSIPFQERTVTTVPGLVEPAADLLP